MTDMHREAFERWCERRGIATSPEHRTYEYQQAYEDWQAAMRYRDEQEQTSVWRCYKEYMSCDGGRVHSEKFAKTKADMLIFKSQGYDCEKLCDEQEKQA